MPSTDPVSSITNCYRLIVSYTDPVHSFIISYRTVEPTGSSLNLTFQVTCLGQFLRSFIVVLSYFVCFFLSRFVLLDGSLCVLYCIVFSVSCVGRVTNLLALFTLIYPPSLCATLSVYRIFVCACNHV